MTPPDVVRTRASSTVLAKASSLVNRDFAGISLIDRHEYEGVFGDIDKGSLVRLKTS